MYKEDETEDHLFISCPVSKVVWTWIFKWCGVNMEQFNSLDHLLSILVDNAACAKKRKMSEAIVGGAVWSIWKARNNLVFKGNSFSAPIVFGEFQASLYTWVKYRGNCKSLLWQMWYSNSFSLLQACLYPVVYLLARLFLINLVCWVGVMALP